MQIKKDLEILIVSLFVFFPVFLLEHEKFFELVENSRQSICENDKNFLMKISNSEDIFWKNLKNKSSENETKNHPAFCDYYNQETLLEEENCSENESTTLSDSKTVLEPEENPMLQAPINFLMIGDSMILEGFGPTLERDLEATKGFSVTRFGKYSTGLNRIDYFDWYSKTRELITQNAQDVLIIMVGANDGQGIKDSSGNSVLLNSDNWDVIYKERVKAYLDEFSPKFKQIYWVGHPIPRTQDFHNKFLRMNKIYSETSALYTNVYYINSWDRFAVDGVYSPTLADNEGNVAYVKSSDGVHVTNHGGKILSDLVIEFMHQYIQFDNEPASAL